MVFRYPNSIYLTRGDTHFFRFSLEDREGNKRDLLEGDKVYFTIKKDTFSDRKVFQKVITEFNEGVVEFSLEPEDTKDLLYGNYVYDIQVDFREGVTKTIIKPSRLTIGEEVTYE